MIYIGFSIKTHKMFANILCRHFRHVAPIVIIGNKCIIYQFTAPHNISLIATTTKGLKILESYGWKFIKYGGKNDLQHALKSKPITCVQFTKCVCGIKNILIQTPDALFKYIQHK